MEEVIRHPATPVATPIMSEKVKQPLNPQQLGPAVTFNLPVATEQYVVGKQHQQHIPGNLTPPPSKKRPLTEVSPNVPSPVSREDRVGDAGAAAAAAHMSMVAIARANKKPRRDSAAAAAEAANSSEVWPPEVDRAFMEALEKIPLLGRRKLMVHNHSKPCGRNELIADYIFRRTGKKRTRKQVSSHIQVLKHIRREDAECRSSLMKAMLILVLKLVSDSMPENEEVESQTYPSLHTFYPIQQSGGKISDHATPASQQQQEQQQQQQFCLSSTLAATTTCCA